MQGRENHYQVVRCYPHPGHGIVEEVLAKNLTIEEANQIADSEPPVTVDEKLMIYDQDETGLAAIIRMDGLRQE